ncbi:MAG: hypothetical protein N2441_05485 [Rhodocyclaceae bacterium]|nr:hypothetical protein [Rhodocyclaceae bacterium]
MNEARKLLTVCITAALVVDVATYAWVGRSSEIVDGVAWLVLFLLFLWETRRRRPWPDSLGIAVHGVRGCASVAVLWAAVSYVQERAWLDAANAWLWLAVVALLESEIRWPQLIGRWRRGFLWLAGLLYGALLLFIPLWLIEGEWLDALDGALWLAAFFFVELDILAKKTEASDRALRA